MIEIITNESPWFNETFLAFNDYAADQERLLRVVIGSMRGSPGILKIFAEETDWRVIELEKEINEGFPRIYTLFLISLWTSFETCISDFVLQWVIRNPEIRKEESFRKLKISLGVWDAISDEDEKARYLLELALSAMPGDSSVESTGFFKRIKLIGLRVSQPESLRLSLLEFQQLRNIILHKRGIADAKMCGLCTDLPYTPGDKIKISGEDLHLYLTASRAYAVILCQAAREKLKLKKLKTLDEGKEEFIKAIEAMRVARKESTTDELDATAKPIPNSE